MISHKSKSFVYPDYISPLPADEFIKGALLKQKMYDEGLTQVQQQLDAYGQIRNSLLKEEDKLYFDQEATKLVSAINKNAGLDFANKNNVRAAMSLGNNLLNDSIISTATQSAATYKKMMDEYNKLDPKNRSNVNDFYFFKDINKWLKDGKPGTKLGYNPYTVYTDEHVKLWQELSTKLKPDVEDVPVFDGASGEWIVQKKYSGVSAQRFRDAYINGLSAQAKNQLEMEARYALESGDKNALSSSYLADLDTKLTDIDLNITKLNDQKRELAAKYGEKSPEVLKLQQQINEFTNTAQYYQNKRGSEVSDNDLISYVRDSKILDAAGAFAYSETSKKLEANPYIVDIRKMQNNIAEYRAKAAIDVEKEQELVSRGLKDGATNASLAAGTYAPDSSYEGKSIIQDMKSFYGQATSRTEATMWAQAIARFSQNKTIQETIERAAGENTMDPTDRRVIAETFSPTDLKGLTTLERQKRMSRNERLMEEMFWKFKGINKALNGDRSIKNNKGEDIPIDGGSIISVLETTGGVRDMSVDAFLRQPGEYLAVVKEIRIKDHNKVN